MTKDKDMTRIFLFLNFILVTMKWNCLMIKAKR